MRRAPSVVAAGVLSLVAVLAAVSARAEEPCRPLRPPRPICVPPVPGPVPTVPSIPPLPAPTVPPVPTPGVPSPSPAPTVPPVPPLPTPGPTSLPPIPPIPPVPPIPPIPPPPSGGVTGWIPSNAGVMWWQGSEDLGVPPRQPAGEPTGAWWLTRRVGVSPHHTEVMHLGSLLHGIYVSAGGGGWVSATPGCLLPMRSPIPGWEGFYEAVRRASIAATGLDACGVEGIAYDPLFPARVYASAFDVTSLGLSGARIAEGGVYVSEDFGLHWRKLLGGIRGNGLAVSRSGTGPATIVAGYIQVDNNTVGSTPGNGSLSVSTDEGRTWREVVLPPSGCADGVLTSQRITPTVAFNAVDPKIVYAGTNAGLYVSTDGGGSFRLARQACGGSWGVATSRDGSTLYVGDHEATILKGNAAGDAFTVLKDLGSGRIQSLLVDPILPDRLYAAVWDGGAASVWRIDTRTGASARLGDSLLAPADQALWPGAPRPFPLTIGIADGTSPALFLARPPGRLLASTILRGAFVRVE